MSLAALFENGTVEEAVCLKTLNELTDDTPSDNRLSHLLMQTTRPRNNKATNGSAVSLDEVGEMTFSPKSIKISLAKEHGEDFSKFLEAELEALLQRYRQSLKKQ